MNVVPRAYWIRAIVGLGLAGALVGLPAQAGPQHSAPKSSAGAWTADYLAVLSDALRRMRAYDEQGRQRAAQLRLRWSSLRALSTRRLLDGQRPRAETRLAHALHGLVQRDRSRRQSLVWARREAAQAWLATQARELLTFYRPVAATVGGAEASSSDARRAGGGGLWIWPAAGRPRRPFGGVEVEGLRFPRTSIEMRVPASSPVVSAADGVVAEILEMPDGASSVLIRHAGDDRSRCSGLAGLRVEVGQRVSAGEVIGRARAARGATIVFALRRADEAVDPANLLR